MRREADQRKDVKGGACYDFVRKLAVNDESHCLARMLYRWTRRLLLPADVDDASNEGIHAYRV